MVEQDRRQEAATRRRGAPHVDRLQLRQRGFSETGGENGSVVLPWLALTRLSTDGVADASTTGKLPIWPRTTAMSRAL